jgi:hypothetical protein
MARRLLATIAICMGSAVAAASAGGAGGPSAGVQQGWDGLANGAVRYVAVPVGDSTSVQVIRRQDGRVLQFMALKGPWGIPVVAYDGTAAGLMGDRRTLLLGEATAGPRLRKHSAFALVDMKRMRVAEAPATRTPGLRRALARWALPLFHRVRLRTRLHSLSRARL